MVQFDGLNNNTSPFDGLMPSYDNSTLMPQRNDPLSFNRVNNQINDSMYGYI
jgi:hypothetical protein